MSKRLCLISSYILAAVFIIAGVSKFFTLSDFISLLYKYHLFPIQLVPLLSVLLLCVEITAGICLIIPNLRKIGALLSGGLLTMFLCLIGYVLIAGIEVHCGCFSFLHTREMGLGLAIQDTILLILSIGVFRNEY